MSFQSPNAVEAVAEGVLLGAYRVVREGKKASEPSGVVTRVQLAGVTHEDAVRRGLAAARATVLVRDLANTRSSTKGPAWLARTVDGGGHGHCDLQAAVPMA